ncbi:hypothetical protein ACHMW5_13660 [Azospirillum melinis]|uniref:hypothetical protein n=1 Tax=Azospirillum melinis TaxID=328839 RepID=UPI0037579CAE
MPDPAGDSSWLATLVGGSLMGGGAIVAGWQWLMARMKASTEEARAERKAARAEAVENDIIASLEKQVERMQGQIDRLIKHVAEQDDKIEELNKLLGEAMDARVQVMVEATKYREHNAALEAKINIQQATIEAQQSKITTLTQAYNGLSEFVGRLDLSESERSAAPYREAAGWLGQNRDRLAGAA